PDEPAVLSIQRDVRLSCPLRAPWLDGNGGHFNRSAYSPTTSDPTGEAEVYCPSGSRRGDRLKAGASSNPVAAVPARRGTPAHIQGTDRRRVPRREESRESAGDRHC